MKAMSLRAGKSATYIRSVLDRGQEPSVANFEAIARALGVTAAELRGEKSPAKPGWGSAQELSFRRALDKIESARDGVLEARDSGPPPEAIGIGDGGWSSRGTDVPVYGTVAGSVIGQIAMSSEPTSWLLRPPGLMPKERVYALVVRGVSMEPRYREGDLVFVAPDRPRRAGDIVVVQTRNHDGADIQASIKEMARENVREVVARQYNPPAELAIRRATILAVHRVLTLNELLGL